MTWRDAMSMQELNLLGCVKQTVPPHYPPAAATLLSTCESPRIHEGQNRCQDITQAGNVLQKQRSTDVVKLIMLPNIHKRVRLAIC